LCRECGALVGAGEERCGVCGAPAARVPAAEVGPPVRDRETVRFIRAIINRPATFTFVFLIANVFLYLLMTFSGGAIGDVLVAYGAKVNGLIDQQGQWWRFVTPIFLHVYLPHFPWPFGALHLISNMYGLFMLGPYVEKLYGSARFVVFWIVTGVAGVAASYLTVQRELAESGELGRFLFKRDDVPSAGASGALFGLIGVLFVFGIKYRRELPAGLKRAFGTGMLPTILINLFIGYVGRGFIDNAAHLGGLACGMLLALAADYKRIGPRGPVAYTWHFFQVACLALVVVGFAQVYRHFDATPPRWDNLAARPPQAPQVPPGLENIEAFRDAVNESNEALDAFFRSGDGARFDAALDKLNRSQGVDAQADLLRDELKTLVARGRDLAADARLPRRERDARARRLAEDHDGWYARFQQWVETSGRDYGVTLEEKKK
jgi:rhomboid protease GluP